MNCQECEFATAADLLQSRVADHLEGCESCRQFVREIGENRAALASLAQEPFPFELAAIRRRVIANLQAERQPRRYWVWSGFAAAVCVGLLCLAAVLPWTAPTPPEPVRFAVAVPETVTEQPQVPPSRSRHRSKQRLARGTQPAVIQMLTNDPNVVIIWLSGKQGESL